MGESEKEEGLLVVVFLQSSLLRRAVRGGGDELW